MNAETGAEAIVADDLTPPQQLLRSSVHRLEEFAGSLRPVRKALRCAAELGDERTKKRAFRLLSQLDRLEPNITMIGQIKSGKTSVVNCMIGWPDLLPADVNPWTSVVTSLHLSPAPLTPETSATFRFFKQDEWDRLIGGGGRIGELANRAGADEEMAKIRAQIEQMREKSQARLGRKFELLLGQQHDYGYFDPELIERYVCLGDDFEDEDAGSTAQGRFADITRSADLSFHQPALPIRLCIRDTPGVNDTFMMREQITIRSIRDSRICIVVLSAHQALSSTDLALIRLISNVKSRDVILYINRIDELSDPAAQVPQIRASIIDTLTRHEGPADVGIIFGSALWAQCAAKDQLAELPDASKEALFNWAEVTEHVPPDEKDPNILLWHLSGMPALYDAIAERIIDGIGAETVAQVTASARNLLNGLQLSDNLSSKAQVDTASICLGIEEIETALREMRDRMTARLTDDLTAIHEAGTARFDRAHSSFLERATEALISHLEKYGEDSVWEYSPAGLRVLLSSSYKLYGTKCQSAYSAATGDTVSELGALYRKAFQTQDMVDIQVPPAPRVPPPVSLGQTIALDLKGSWWKSWWLRRRGYQSHAASFHALIKAETDSIVADLKNDQVRMVRDATLAQFHDFLEEQCAIMLSAAGSNTADRVKSDDVFGLNAQAEREKELTEAHRCLDEACLS